MTILIYHASGDRGATIYDEGKKLRVIKTIGDGGGMEGLDTAIGRMVVLAARDVKQEELPVQVMKPGKKEFETILFKKDEPLMFKFGLAQETPFGLNPILTDCVGIERC